jgi:hypothetical protein
MFENRAYLLDVTSRVPTERTIHEIVDILQRCRYTQFLPYSTTGKFPESLDLGRLKTYCEIQGIELIPTDETAFLSLMASGKCVRESTQAPKSLTGRIEEMRERMQEAEMMGRGRKTFIVTDFSDGYQWQPLAVSLPGIILGGAFAASGAKAARMDLEGELNTIIDAPIGGLILKLGTLYLRGGAVHEDSSEYFNILSQDVGYSRHMGLTQYVLDDVSGVARGVRIQAERWADRTDWAKEIVYMADLIDCACHRRDEARLRNLRDEHGRIWRMRFHPEGRIESLALLPQF